MAIPATSNFVHWNYFLALEQDLAEVARFIEFSPANFNTYSIELAHLLLAASSEVDVVMKALCNVKKPAKKHENIQHYKQTVQAKFPALINETCSISRYGMTLTPWSNWQVPPDASPDWWKSYNNVKHQRDRHFQEANLKNTINSIAALSIVNLYYYGEILQPGTTVSAKEVTRQLQPESTLIKFKDDYYYSHLIIG